MRVFDNSSLYGADVTLRASARSWLKVQAGRSEGVVSTAFRSDDGGFGFDLGARYTYNPHLRFGASITSYDRSSDLAEFDYDRMVYMLTLEASF